MGGVNSRRSRLLRGRAFEPHKKAVSLLGDASGQIKNRKRGDMNTEKKTTCEKCGGTGQIESGTRKEHGVPVPVFLPCGCQTTEPDTADDLSDFIGRVVIDSPEKFWG